MNFQRGSFPQAAVLQELLKHGCSLWDSLLQEQGCSCMGSSSPGASAPVRTLHLTWALHRLQLILRYIHLHGVLHRLQCGYLLSCAPSRAVGGKSASLHCGLLRRRGYFCSSHPSTFFSFFTELGVCVVAPLTFSISTADGLSFGQWQGGSSSSLLTEPPLQPQPSPATKTLPRKPNTVFEPIEVSGEYLYAKRCPHFFLAVLTP